MKDYLSYENARNKKNAHLYERLLKRALHTTNDVAVLIGHHITFELNGDLETENEIPSADTLMFDHELMGVVFGESAVRVMRALVSVSCEHRDALLSYFLDHIDHATDDFPGTAESVGVSDV